SSPASRRSASGLPPPKAVWPVSKQRPSRLVSICASRASTSRGVSMYVPPLAEPRLGMCLDGAGVAHAIRLAEPVGEQHDGLLAALGGLGQDAERFLEREHVLGEAVVPAEAQRHERAHQL